MRLLQQRKKEEKQCVKIKDPNESYSKEISSCINSTLTNKHKVYLVTDLHLFVRDKKGVTTCHKRDNFDQIIKNYTSIVNAKDVVIFMGDLVDGEFQDKDTLKNIILSLPGKKILVRGNNDLFDYAFYRSCGFTYVTYEFIMNKIVYTHAPIQLPKDCIMNVHGHIHNFKTYWVPYKNMIDVAFVGGREKPVELHTVLEAQKKYAKLVNVCPEHFNETFVMNPFQQALMESGIIPKFIPDPFDD